MKFYLPSPGLFPKRLWALFNLNDQRWGRGDDKPTNAGDSPNAAPPENEESQVPPKNGNDRGRKPKPNAGPPDLDELWRDFNRKLGGLFGAPKKPGNNGSGNGSGGGGYQPDMKSAGMGASLIAGVLVLIWLGTGFFIVQEGQQAVITQFGKYARSVEAGLRWRLPYPIERHEMVFVTQARSLDVGRDSVVKATGLRESAMLTEDENIVEIKFAVQYRLSDARAFLFASKKPEATVMQAAESAVREVVGKMRMDSALSENREQIAPTVRQLTQEILDRYGIGIEVVGITLQEGGVRAPDQVQEAFDDVLKAGQERERAKNEAQAYANDVIPRAVGSASRLKEEADAYKAKIIAQAQGDAQRFKSVLAEYQKAPQVTRDRLYLDTMQQIYSNVTKVVVDSKQGSNLLYLPLDKLLQQSAGAGATVDTGALAASSASGSTQSVDARTRDAVRSRERDLR